MRSYYPIYVSAAAFIITTILLITGCADKSKNPEPPTYYTLSESVGVGVEGYPSAGEHMIPVGEMARYGYQLQPEFSDPSVLLDSVSVAPVDSFVMDSDHRLDASCRMRIVWHYDVPQPVYYCTPAIGDDGTIYFSTGIYLPGLGGWRPGAVYALNADGTLKWSYDVGKSLYSPALGSDNQLYIMDKDYKVYAFSTAGSLAWTFDSFEHSVFVKRDMGQRTPAIAADGTIYVGADGLYALNPVNGERLWYFPRSAWGVECIASPVIGSDNTIYVMIGEDSLYAVNPDGSRQWAFGFDHEDEMSFATPAIDRSGVIYLTSESISAGSHIYAVNPDGTRKWQYAVEDDRFVRASPAIGADGTIYIATKAGGSDLSARLIALSPGGSKQWAYIVTRTHQTPDDCYSSPSVGADGIIYFGAETGYLYAVNSNGTLNWSHLVHSGINWSSPTILDNGTILIGGMPPATEYVGTISAVVSSSHGYADSPWPKFHHDNKNTGRY